MPEVTRTYFARDRTRWRAWLRSHHADRDEVWLVFVRKGQGTPGVTYEHAVEEALCWGWIDGIRKRLDERRYVCRFSPRRPGSNWSPINRERIARLERAGKLAAPGKAALAAARRDGTFTREATRDDSVPAGLHAALAAARGARAAFDALPAGQRKLWLYWINDARRDDTRARRIARTVEGVLAGRRPGT